VNLALALAVAESPEERAEVGAVMTRYYASGGRVTRQDGVGGQSAAQRSTAAPIGGAHRVWVQAVSRGHTTLRHISTRHAHNAAGQV
jgi:hypothetical protein